VRPPADEEEAEIMNADNRTGQPHMAIIEAGGIGPQVRAEEREAFAVEREALAVERESGGLVPPEPPTMVELLAAAQEPVMKSELMLAGLPADAPPRAFLESVNQQSKAIVRRILQEMESQAPPIEPIGPPAAKTRK
jgi:hypothetical protein